MTNPLRVVARGAAMVCCLAAFVCTGTGPAAAGVTGSRHGWGPNIPADFATKGVCSACHLPHFAMDPLKLWPRNLTGMGEERDVYKSPLAPTGSNYIPGSTLVCYDCHDDAVSAGTDPPLNVFPHPPQDVALYGTNVGYYELIDGTLPPPVPNTAGDPTGGHYWKSIPSGSGAPNQGDKILCELCHDPHKRSIGGVDNTNDAFFLTETALGNITPVTLGNGLRASPNAHDETPGGTGREMCAACHMYSEEGSGSPKSFWNVQAPRPKDTIPQHSQNQPSPKTPCTDCHQHNKIFASCTQCHGYPPLLTSLQGGGAFDPNHATRKYVENYAGGAGAHQRHLDALGSAMLSQCDICHGPNPGSASWHNPSRGTTVSAGNVNVMYKLAYWSPAGYPVALTPAYQGSAAGPNPGDALYATTSQMGGGTRTCSGLACHGNPAPGALAWTADMIDGDEPLPERNTADGDLGICKECHDSTDPAVVGAGPYAPGVMGNGLASTAGFGAEVNGHGVGLPGAVNARYDRDGLNDELGINGAAKECTVCHNAAYQATPPPTPPTPATPFKTHFDAAEDSAEKRLVASVNDRAAVNADDFCVNCHQYAGTAAGTQLSHHGNDETGGYQALEASFTRSCRQCHNVHGLSWNGTTRNLNMIGTSLDENNDGRFLEPARVDSNALTATVNITTGDNAVDFRSRTGANSFDEGGEGTGTNPGPDDDDICATCHDDATTRGGDHSGTTGMNDERGNNCLACHDHDFDDVPATPDAFMPSGCAGCHGEDCNVHRGADGTQNTADDAPNVITTDCGTPPGINVYDGTWWDTQRGGNNATQQGGHGDPDGVEGGNANNTPGCLACHNTGLPSPNTHLDGVYNSVGSELPMPWMGGVPRAKANQNTNTSHLVAGYFTGASGNDYSWQVAMDKFCSDCHAIGTNNVTDMRHERDTTAGDPNHHSVELGTHLTMATVTGTIMDSDVTTSAGGAPHYAPCVACHNPHGSTNTDTKGGASPGAKNWMIIDNRNWQSNPPTLCTTCHQ